LVPYVVEPRLGLRGEGLLKNVSDSSAEQRER
jgi:hypothetical protein